MRDWSWSFGAKALCLFLLAVATLAALLSGTGVLYLQEQGGYDGTEYPQTSACRTITQRYLGEAIEAFHLSGVTTSEWATLYGEHWVNFGFEIVSAEDPDVVLTQYNVPKDAVPNTTLQWIFDEMTLIARGYVHVPILPGDSYQASSRWYDTLLALRYWMIAALALSVAVVTVLLVLLCCAAGHRAGSEEIVLNALDRIPMDIFLAGVLLLTGIPLALVIDRVSLSRVLEIIIFYAALLYAVMMAAGALISFAARLKAGAWWKNTAVYFLLRLLGRGIRTLFRGLEAMGRALPLVWRAALTVLCALALDAILLGWFQNAWSWPLPALMLLSYNALLLILVCRLALGVRRLRGGVERLALGDFSQPIETVGMAWDIRRLAENINLVRQGMSIAVEQRLKSERLKTELITNVSHDIKTPLTSIINYVDLMKKEPLPPEAAGYLQVLDRQSMRLKKLTEDLVEASKASTGNLPVELRPADLCELVRQAMAEYGAPLEKASLTPELSAPPTSLAILADGRLLWRVLDNLLNNVCKYALEGTRVYVQVVQAGQQAVVTIKNVSRDRLNLEPEELIERFVRGDSARASEGSGLGLNIAQSLTLLQRGAFRVSIDGDLFKVELRFPLAEE